MVDRSTSTSAWTTNRIVALVIGIVFFIVGVLGLIFDTTSGSVFGFDVDLVHNLVHVLTGILGLAAAFTGWSRRFNQIFGVIYLLVGLAAWAWVLPPSVSSSMTLSREGLLPLADAKILCYAHNTKGCLCFSGANAI
ncbi:MAG: DUF4383 domain-containing protein [Chloroflexota bacterium]|nr:MAG: DUF4383 domain-containing protein [Chloroflexota bacterium]